MRVPASPVKVKGHGLDSRVVTRWRRLWKDTQVEARELRDALSRAGNPSNPNYREGLVKAFVQTTLEDALLTAQFHHTMQQVECLQVRGGGFELWSPILSQSLKVAATLKGTRYHKLLTLREITRLLEPGVIPEKSISLTEYLASDERAERAKATQVEASTPKRTSSDGRADSAPSADSPQAPTA